jgi:hypothetical protein
VTTSTPRSPQLGTSRGHATAHSWSQGVGYVFKIELIKPHGHWRIDDQVGLATLDYVDWYNHQWLPKTLQGLSTCRNETAY